MADYKFRSPNLGGVYRYSDGMSISENEGNPRWKEYQAYAAAGGLTDPYQTFEQSRLSKAESISQDCQEYIYSLYPAPIQSSMSLGVYPPWVVDAAAETIALCVEEENRVNDIIMATTTQAELDATEDPVWPEAIEPVDPTS